MKCLACGSTAEGSFCPSCSILEYPDLIKTYCINSPSKNPLEMAQEIMSHPQFPVAGQAHHPLIAAVLVAAHRNAGGNSGAEKIEEAVKRGNSLPGGFCAGFGADAAAIACGISVSVIKGNTISAQHATGRSLAHLLTGEGMLTVANNTGNRCCKRSVYSMIEVAGSFFARTMGTTFDGPQERACCPFTEKNKLCNGPSCKYFPKSA